MNRIIILDPESSDPTWGSADEALTLDLPTGEAASLSQGHTTIREILDARKAKDVWVDITVKLVAPVNAGLKVGEMVSALLSVPGVKVMSTDPTAGDPDERETFTRV